MLNDRSWRPLLALIAVAVGVILTRDQLGDYNLGESDDNAAPTIHFLADGQLGSAVDVMPAMGLVSLLLRVPSAVVGGSDLLLSHRLGSAVCLLAVVALAFVLDRRAVSNGRPLEYRAALALVVIAGPTILWSIDSGHPEEYLGGALCVAAVLAAVERRTVLAALLLGLALGTKQWAVLAIVPTLLPIGAPTWFDRERLKAGALAALVAAIFVVPPIAASPSRYQEISQNLTQTDRVYPESIWWPVSTPTTRTLPLGAGETTTLTTWRLPLGLSRGFATGLAVLISLVIVPFALRGGGLRDPLATLTALMTLRAIFDPMNLGYYLAPALLALAAWEVWRGPPRRLPLISIVAALATFAAWSLGAGRAPELYWAVWVAATFPLLLVCGRDRWPRPQRPATSGGS